MEEAGGRTERLLKILNKKIIYYEELTILGCAVEGNSSSHHGSRHRADHHVMYGQWPILKWRNGKIEKMKNGEKAREAVSALWPFYA